MPNNPQHLIQKLWNYCNILWDDGLSYGDYMMMFLLFLKIADEQSRPPSNNPTPVVEKLEAVVSASLQRANRIRQTILQKAFIGNKTRGSHNQTQIS